MKYYVKLGKFTGLRNAGNPYQACIMVLKQFLQQTDIQKVPLFFSISERGFCSHDDDIIVQLHEIVKILQIIARDC